MSEIVIHWILASLVCLSGFLVMTIGLDLGRAMFRKKMNFLTVLGWLAAAVMGFVGVGTIYLSAVFALSY